MVGLHLAEAGMLAAVHTRRKKILVSDAIHPEYRDVVATYAYGQSIEIVTVPTKDGVTDIEALKSLVDDKQLL